MCSSHCATPTTNPLITKQGKSIWVESKQKDLVFKSKNPMIIANNCEANIGILQQVGHTPIQFFYFFLNYDFTLFN